MKEVLFNLKELRNSKKMTQSELSEKSGIMQQNISLYEQGVQVPRIDTAAKLAVALGVSLDELIHIRDVHELVAEKLNKIIK